MDTKLTLKIDKDVIERAKIFAKKRNVSLSSIVEHYLEYIVDDKDKNEYTTIVKELSGIISLPENYDLKRDYVEYLLEKHKV